MPAWLLPAVIILLYAAALGRQAFVLFGKQDDNRALVLSLGGAALLLHAWLLNQNLWATSSGVNLGLLNVVELTAWLLSLVITLAAARFSVIVLIPVVYACAIGAILLGSSIDTVHITQPSPSLTLHIVLALSAYILLLCATLYSVMLRSVDRHLKRHDLLSLPKALPPLMTMEHHLIQLIFGGWLMLSLALVSGGFQIYDLLAQQQAHKLFFTLSAWCAYSLLLLGHWRWGWRGRRTQTGVYVAFGLLTLGYFGSRFVLSFLLGDVQA